MRKRLFGTAGIRGRYLEEVTPQLAFEVGAALVTYLGADKIVVGGDGRLTTPLLKLMASAGAMATGAEVLDVGLVPLPTLAWSVSNLGGDAGIFITASHNPPTDNGIKVFNSMGMEFTESMEQDLEGIIFSKSWRLADWDHVGNQVLIDGVIEDYIDRLTEVIMPSEFRKKPKVLIDTANGAPSLVTPRVLKNIGADVVSINAHIDGRFPGRAPEPRPNVLEPFLPIAKVVGADIYLAHDGDGDRLAVLDPAKGFIKQDRIIALIAKHKLKDRKGTIVVSIDVGNAVRDVVESEGGKLAVVKLGKIHEGLLKHPDAVLAAEPWKLIDPSWGPWIDGIYQAAYLVRLMIEEGLSIGQLMKSVPNYPQARFSIRVPKDMKEQVFEAMKEKLLSMLREGEGQVITIDGLRVNFPDKSWILIRKSGTEPKVRIYGESMDQKKLEDMVESLIGAARKCLKIKGLHEISVEGKIIA